MSPGGQSQNSLTPSAHPRQRTSVNTFVNSSPPAGYCARTCRAIPLTVATATTATALPVLPRRHRHAAPCRCASAGASRRPHAASPARAICRPGRRPSAQKLRLQRSLHDTVLRCRALACACVGGVA